MSLQEIKSGEKVEWMGINLANFTCECKRIFFCAHTGFITAGIFLVSLSI